MSRNALLWGATAVLAMGVMAPATARPIYLNTFKQHYQTAQGKPKLNAANCSMCHVGMPAQANFNTYGQALRASLGARNVQDRGKIVAALQDAEKKQNAAAKAPFSRLIAADVLPASAQAPAGGGGGGRATSGSWQPLFNYQNMNGWTKENAGNWVVENGLLKYTGGGNGWLRSNQAYTNYALVVQWRYAQPGNNDSGIFLKAKPGDKGAPWPRSPQLNMGPGDNLGSIGGTQGSRTRPDLVKPLDWNTYQVTVKDGVATLAINGQVAWEKATSDALKGAGHIGVQAENRPLEIAGVWIMPLP